MVKAEGLEGMLDPWMQALSGRGVRFVFAYTIMACGRAKTDSNIVQRARLAIHKHKIC